MASKKRKTPPTKGKAKGKAKAEASPLSHDDEAVAEPLPLPVDEDEAFPLNDFNERQSERFDLLKELKSLIGNKLIIAATVWACCQLADTECLEVLMNNLVKVGPVSMSHAIDDSLDIVKQCKSSDFQSLLRVF